MARKLGRHGVGEQTDGAPGCLTVLRGRIRLTPLRGRPTVPAHSPLLRRMQPIQSSLILTAAAAILLACSDGSAPDVPIPPETFVAVVSELREAAAVRGGDVEAFEQDKAAILARAGVTDSTLYAFVRAHRQDLGGLAAAWDSVNLRLMTPVDSAR